MSNILNISNPRRIPNYICLLIRLLVRIFSISAIIFEARYLACN